MSEGAKSSDRELANQPPGLSEECRRFGPIEGCGCDYCEQWREAGLEELPRRVAKEAVVRAS